MKFCLVAEGRADLYPRFGPTMEWDTAAGQAVLEGSGGSVREPQGGVMVYNRADLLNGYFIARSAAAAQTPPHKKSARNLACPAFRSPDWTI